MMLTLSVRTASGTSWGSTYFPKDPQYGPQRRRFCIDDAFLAAVKTTPHRPDVEFAPYTEQRIDYVLTTGANWKAPIGDFHMTIDKGSTANLVSFCGNGVAKISPTQFEVHYTNFTPTKDVAILLLVPISQQ